MERSELQISFWIEILAAHMQPVTVFINDLLAIFIAD